MTTPPESSSFDAQSERISDYEAGLAALKEAEYAAAIVLLEPALTDASDHPVVVRAQMGLAIAYEKMGETQRAVHLCQTLQQHPNPPVQDWANRTLTSIQQRHPELAETPAPAAPPPPIPDSPVEPTATANSAGFTPLDQTTLPPTISPSASTTTAPTTGDGSAPLAPGESPTLGRRASGRSPQPTAEPIPVAVVPFQPQWRQAGRAQQWKSLGKVKLWRLILAQIVTAIAIYFAVQQVLFFIITSYGTAIVKTLPRLGFRIVQPGTPTWTEFFTISMLLILLFGSRWILDGLLTVGYGLKPLSLSQLRTYSPEAVNSLPQFCRKRRIPVPTLGLLPTQAPLIFTYGVLPHISRTVVSQGVLDQLADDEIAALYAGEVGHLSQWTVPLLSGITTLLQLPFTLYWVTAEWGNRKPSPITKASSTILSVISYGFFWLWRWVPLWLARQRVLYGDRAAAELTGNPNGYTRALLKLAIATVKDLQTQSQTNYLLEGFELLTPLGYRQAIPLGSLYPYGPLEPSLEWERTYPLRHSLAINHPHPPTGDRLNLLTLYARHWQLDPELNWTEINPRRAQRGLSGPQWRSLLLQGAPYFGVVAGLAIAIGLKVLGTVANRFRWDSLSWMASDTTILIGLPLVFLCIGILIRLNRFFPDLPPRFTTTNEAIATVLTSPTVLPLNSTPVQLEGTLLGRRGISNVLNQDLWLNTPTGIIKLHCIASVGFLDSAFPVANRPGTLVNSTVTATGWLRRGLTPWLDVDTLRTTGGRTHRSHHPVWSFLIAAIAALWGILTLFNFNF